MTSSPLYLFVGIDRTSKFAVTQLVEKADRRTAWEFLQYMLEAIPYQVHTILTDNEIQFAEQPIHYESHDQLRTHLRDFMAAYNFARRLKTLGGLTPYEYICKIWTSEPDRFILDPIHQMPGLNTYATDHPRRGHPLVVKAPARADREFSPSIEWVAVERCGREVCSPHDPLQPSEGGGEQRSR